MTTEAEIERRVETAQVLSRLETKMDTVIATLGEMRAVDKEHEQRITSLEGSRTWLVGVGAGAGGLFGWLTKLFE